MQIKKEVRKWVFKFAAAFRDEERARDGRGRFEMLIKITVMQHM